MFIAAFHCDDPARDKSALGLSERPLGPLANGWIASRDFYDAALTGKPYCVRALFEFGSNLLVSHPPPERGREALKAHDFSSQLRSVPEFHRQDGGHRAAKALRQRLSNLTLVTHLSRPRSGDRFDRLGRFTASNIDVELRRQRGRFYMCASDTMMEEVVAGLHVRGVPIFEIFKQRFRFPAPPVLDGLMSRQIHFARSGRSLIWSPQGTARQHSRGGEKRGHCASERLPRRTMRELRCSG